MQITLLINLPTGNESFRDASVPFLEKFLEDQDYGNAVNFLFVHFQRRIEPIYDTDLGMMPLEEIDVRARLNGQMIHLEIKNSFENWVNLSLGERTKRLFTSLYNALPEIIPPCRDVDFESKRFIADLRDWFSEAGWLEGKDFLHGVFYDTLHCYSACDATEVANALKSPPKDYDGILPWRLSLSRVRNADDTDKILAYAFDLPFALDLLKNETKSAFSIMVFGKTPNEKMDIAKHVKSLLGEKRIGVVLNHKTAI